MTSCLGLGGNFKVLKLGNTSVKRSDDARKTALILVIMSASRHDFQHAVMKQTITSVIKVQRKLKRNHSEEKKRVGRTEIYGRDRKN
jgi:hypothetical protein